MTREPLPKALRVRSMMVCSDCGAYVPEGMADPEHPGLCLDCAEQEEPEPYPNAIRTAGRFLLRNPSAADQDVADQLLAVGEAGGVEVAAHARELLVAAFRHSDDDRSPTGDAELDRAAGDLDRKIAEIAKLAKSAPGRC